MLVLSRKTQEQIQIRDDIIIEVVSIGHNRVKLAISAPSDVSIRRTELPSTVELDISRGEKFPVIRLPATNPR